MINVHCILTYLQFRIVMQRIRNFFIVSSSSSKNVTRCYYYVLIVKNIDEVLILRGCKILDIYLVDDLSRTLSEHPPMVLRALLSICKGFLHTQFERQRECLQDPIPASFSPK